MILYIHTESLNWFEPFVKFVNLNNMYKYVFHDFSVFKCYFLVVYIDLKKSFFSIFVSFDYCITKVIKSLIIKKIIFYLFFIL